jgi:predicted SAM-dependent methyltransferase
MGRLIRNLFEAIHLDDFVKHHLVAWRRMVRRASGVDRRISESYLADHQVRKLHLGCGDHCIEGWLNSSLNSRVTSILNLDVTQRFPFDDNTFDYVFSEHVIEHIPFVAGRHMLAESFRVLRPGGRVRVTTPNLAFLAKLYSNGHEALEQQYVQWASQSCAAAFADAAFVVNNFVRSWGHQFIYDERVLRFALESAGFGDVKLHLINSSDDRHLRNLENESRMPPGFLRLESLVLEGRKPDVNR